MLEAQSGLRIRIKKGRTTKFKKLKSFKKLRKTLSRPKKGKSLRNETAEIYRATKNGRSTGRGNTTETAPL